MDIDEYKYDSTRIEQWTEAREQLYEKLTGCANNELDAHAILCTKSVYS